MPGPEDPRARLLAKFRTVTLERVQKLNEHLHQLEERPDAAEVIADLMREIHTVKGEAKIMGFAEINKVAHRTEDLLLLVREQGFARLTREQRDRIITGFDLIVGLIESGDEAQTWHSSRIDAFLDETAAAAAATPAKRPAARGAARGKSTAGEGSPRPPARKTEKASAARTADGAAKRRPGPASEARAAKPARPETRVAPGKPAPMTAAAASSSAVEAVGAPAEDFVRVTGDQLAALTALSGELLVRQDQVDRMLTDVGGISARWQASLQQLAAVAAHQASGGGDLKSLTRLSTIGRELASTVARAREEAFENRLHLVRLQDRVRGMRLLDLGSLFNRLPRAIRELAREQGKGVRVRVEGAEVAVDKQVLDQLDEPLLHIIRNAVDHGLEPAGERRARGKDPDGEIRLSARQAGGHVEVTVSDDGRGVDQDSVRRLALTRGLLSEEEEAALSRDELYGLLFQSGFSTREQATDISGRGIGLDVVGQRIDALGGEVHVESEVGRGTRFVLRVPISVALSQVLVFRCGGGLYAVPSVAVEAVLRAKRASLERAGQGRALRRDGERVPVVDLADVLQVPAAHDDAPIVQVVLLQHAGQRLALVVERFEGEREVVRQGLDPFIAGVGVIGGTALLGGRQLVLFLHLPELYRRALSGSRRTAAPVRAGPRARARILVVEDSELTRVMLVSIIERLGYRVAEAVDGAEALRAIERERPDLIMTDLDMPIMDGFELIERVREDAQLRDVPIIVMSTRGAEEDKRRAMDVGANAYVVKTDFREADLLQTFHLYLSEG